MEIINRKNEKHINQPINLTLDSNLQHLIRRELIKGQKDFGAIGSAAILMNVNNGKVLSLVSLPDYDLNKRISIDHESYLNKITKGVYELGSVFKTFTLAAALENDVVEVETVLFRIFNFRIWKNAKQFKCRGNFGKIFKYWSSKNGSKSRIR